MEIPIKMKLEVNEAVDFQLFVSLSLNFPEKPNQETATKPI